MGVAPADLSRIYQALRYAVNDEVEDLDRFLRRAAGCLTSRGRLVVLSYESITDRRVKALARGPEGGRQGAPFRMLTRHVVRPDRAEVVANPRARSARLRALERME
jgi:16S rRNA (cytosine1402-N4)-methyltransferase